MKAVNVDDVLKILHKYGKYIFVTDEKKYSSMIDEIENLKALELPKGHKRLIEDNFDVGPVFDEEGNVEGYRYVTREDLDNADTIVEADDSESEEEND